jgi:ribonuclease HI
MAADIVDCRAMDETVELWTDGACSGNPGPGGWAAILRWNGHERVLSGGEALTTNNRMELMSVIRGLEAITRPMHVVVHTDSAYVEGAFRHGWLRSWQRNGWRNAARQPVRNRDLWERLAELAEGHRIEFQRVRGHAGVELNERVDRLAVEQRDLHAA